MCCWCCCDGPGEAPAWLEEGSGDEPAATVRVLLRMLLALMLTTPLLLFSRAAERRGADAVAGLSAFVSLHSGQFRIAADTVSLIRTQWYFSAMVAVVLLMPPWPLMCTSRAISYCL